MIVSLVLKSLARGKARFACAAAGVAAAAGAVVFTFSLAATNAAQAPALAERAVRPWAAWKVEGRFGWGRRGGRGADAATPASPRKEKGRARADRKPAWKPDVTLPLVGVTIDYRPGGRVLQGPPMRAVIAPAPAASPWDAAPLVEGRWPSASAAEPEIVCTRNTLKRFGRGKGAAIGETITFVGRAGTLSARLVGYLAETKLPMGFPGVFANDAAFSRLAAEPRGSIALWREPVEGVPGIFTARSETVVNAFTGDEQRRMDYARPLMLIAAVLTALALLVNSLLLSVEANRKQLAVLRTIGLTRGGVVRFVAVESLVSAGAGLVAGIGGALGALALYVAADPAAFPTGAAPDIRAIGISAALTPLVAVLATLFALRPALSVRAMDAAARRPRSRRRGMGIAFACGFGAFVAVEVWGASLMRGFVPSPEWPDAIVSVLPSGVSSFEVEKLRSLDGVARVSELYPLQLEFPPATNAPPARWPANALFLAAEWLPEFRFVEGTHAEASRAIAEGDACVVSWMIARARGLHKGDRLTVMLGGRRGPRTSVSLPIAGVVDVNWHMVTSRGLVRGLNGAPPMTDGPVFVSLDTIESLDARPAPSVRMTHLWVEYEPDFLARHGVFPAGRRVERAIAFALGGPDGSTVRLHARDEIADGTLAHGSDVIGQAARVPFVFLAILAIGFVAMLVAEADASKREYVVLRAVGATRGQLVRRLAARALRTAAAGIVCGLPAGAAAGWYFAIGTAARWPGMPNYFVVPWRIVAEGAAGAVVFALLVAVPTAAFLVSRARNVVTG